MSICSVKCNEIKQKLDNISGLSDNCIFALLEIAENIIDFIDFHYDDL